MSSKTKVAIIGSGNIGTDLMYKLRRSPTLELTWMVGVVPESEGLARARALGYRSGAGGIEELMEHRSEFEIAFDATTAKAHRHHAELLRGAGKFAIDLTPAAVGEAVVPTVNPAANLEGGNLNLITCGGQATVPIIAAINRVSAVAYAEIVSTVASRSAGPGTRQNIDEFTETTARALVEIGGAGEGKAIIILNPAEPPLLMRNTVYARVGEGKVDRERIITSVEEMAASVRQYVPGYRLKAPPLFDGDVVTVLLEIEGSGDYLPRYAGNLDIMTSAAVRVGEQVAHWLQAGR